MTVQDVKNALRRGGFSPAIAEQGRFVRSGYSIVDFGSEDQGFIVQVGMSYTPEDKATGNPGHDLIRIWKVLRKEGLSVVEPDHRLGIVRVFVIGGGR